MHTENSVVVHAPLSRILALGADIGDWPRILPHYRFVEVLSDDGRVKMATMGAWRDFDGFSFPVRWQTAQVVLPEERRILFFHTGGVSRGMYVEWNLTPLPEGDGGGVLVTISHELSYGLDALTGWFAHYVVGETFVSFIASRTLARIKQIAEEEYSL